MNYADGGRPKNVGCDKKKGKILKYRKKTELITASLMNCILAENMEHVFSACCLKDSSYNIECRLCILTDKKGKLYLILI
jgi:hypothetical protein